MDVRTFIQTNKVLGPIYKTAAKVYKDSRTKSKFRRDFKCKKVFVNRSNGSDKLCVVLAGYKSFAYSAVFSRIKAFAPKDMDICVASSGLYSQELADICEKNNWSYLSTSRNQVALIQNVAISLHPKAQYVFKLDEDIFITKNYFENMMRAYEHAQNSDFCPGVIAPILPINGYAHLRLLDKLNLREIYEEKFQAPKHIAGPHRQIESNPEVAKFFWGEGGYVPPIDDLNARFSAEPLAETVCPIRFSIGAILFERSFWEEMGHFDVSRLNNGMGIDEIQMCSQCCLLSRPLMVSENIVVGHLSFGTQNAPMKEYFLSHPELFNI